MFRSRVLIQSLAAFPLIMCTGSKVAMMEGNANANTNTNPDFRVHQPSFSATSLHKQPKKALTTGKSEVTIDSLKLISGSSNPRLAESIAKAIDVPLCPATISRFSDGEVSIQINENIRGKDVFIIQSCAAPVNDSIMELLLTISCARRASARRIVAVIPYFGYKHHRRSSNISFKHNSRFMTSGAADFAMMLQELGVDRVIAIDLQRPGQGLEACFFDNSIPVETILTTDGFVNYLINTQQLQEPVTVIAPNAEVYKKAQNFKQELEKSLKSNVELIPYFSVESGSGPSDVEQLHVQQAHQFDLKGGDAIIIDDMVDTGTTIQSLSQRLSEHGANRVIVCASHGLFTEHAMEIIDASKITKIIVTNSLPLPKNASQKIEQLELAPYLADIILTEHFRTVILEEDTFHDE